MENTNPTPKVQTPASKVVQMGTGHIVRPAETGVVNQSELSIDKIKKLGADTRILEKKAGAAKGAIIGELLAIGQRIQVVLGNEKYELSLQDLQGRVLTEIPAIAQHIEQTGAKNLTLHLPIMLDEAHWGYRPVSFSVEELAGKKTLQMLSEKVALHSPRAEAPLEKIAGKSESLAERFSAMSGAEKGWAIANGAFAAMFIYSAVQNFRGSMEPDMEGHKHVRWGQATLGCLNTLMGGLLAHQTAQQFHIGR